MICKTYEFLVWFNSLFLIMIGRVRVQGSVMPNTVLYLNGTLCIENRCSVLQITPLGNHQRREPPLQDDLSCDSTSLDHNQPWLPDCHQQPTAQFQYNIKPIHPLTSNNRNFKIIVIIITATKRCFVRLLIITDKLNSYTLNFSNQSQFDLTHFGVIFTLLLGRKSQKGK